MKHLFIVNPVAGGKDRHEYVAEQARLALEGSADAYEVYITTAPMDACAKIAAEAASGEELRVPSCGGERQCDDPRDRAAAVDRRKTAAAGAVSGAVVRGGVSAAAAGAAAVRAERLESDRR